jgi:hypothetical protein
VLHTRHVQPGPGEGDQVGTDTAGEVEDHGSLPERDREPGRPVLGHRLPRGLLQPRVGEEHPPGVRGIELLLGPGPQPGLRERRCHQGGRV